MSKAVFTQMKMDLLAISATMARGMAESVRDDIRTDGIEAVATVDCTKLDVGRPGQAKVKSVLVGTEEEMARYTQGCEYAVSALAAQLGKK